MSFEPFSPIVSSVIEARNWSRDVVPQQKGQLIVHDMEAVRHLDTAEKVAHWFATQAPGKKGSSAQFCVDPDSIVQCVPVDGIAWHAPGANQYGIGVEFAGFERMTREEWLDADGTRMLTLGARLFAELIIAKSIPCRALTPEQIVAGWKGIARHMDVSVAFPHRGAHGDPGDHFPYDWFLERIKDALGAPAEA